MRIYFIARGANVQDQIDTVIQREPDLIRVIGKSPLPQNGKIAITMPNLRFYPTEKRELPPHEEKTSIFDVVDQVGNSETGDISVFAYAKEEGEL